MSTPDLDRMFDKQYKEFCAKHPVRAIFVHLAGAFITLCFFLLPVALVIWSLRQITSLFT